MACNHCNGTGWILYKDKAPSPPYKEGSELEYARECVCREPKRAYQNYQNPYDQI